MGRQMRDFLGAAIVGSALLTLAIPPTALEAQRGTAGTRPVVRVATPTLTSITCGNRTTACPGVLRLMPGERVDDLFLHGTALDALDRASAVGLRDGAEVEITLGAMAGTGSRRMSLEAVGGRVPVPGVRLRLQAGQAAVEPEMEILIPGVDRTNREVLFDRPMATALRNARVRFGSCGPLSSEWKIRIDIPSAGYASSVDLPRVQDACVVERDVISRFEVVDVSQNGDRAMATLQLEFGTIEMRAGQAGLTYQYRSVRFISRLPVEVWNGSVRINQGQTEWRHGGGQWTGNRLAVAAAGSGPTPWMRDRMDQISGQIQLALNQSRGALRDEIARTLRDRGVQLVLALDEGPNDEWSVIFRE